MSVFGPMMFGDFDWLVRESSLVLLIIVAITVKNKRFRFVSWEFSLLFLYSVMMVIISLILDNSGFVLLSSLRFVFLYPLLFFIGVNSAGQLKLEAILVFPYLFGIATMFLGILELINPILLSSIRTGTALGLIRSGLGVGIGSIFGDRIVFGFTICFTSAISRIFLKKSYIVLFDTVALVLSIYTLNRTSMIVMTAILSYDLLMIILAYMMTISRLLTALVISLAVVILFYKSSFMGDSVSKFMFALREADITLSGRTIMWREDAAALLSIAPNFSAFGNYSRLGIRMATSDNSYFRILINYGILVLVPVLAVIWKLLSVFRKLSSPAKAMIFAIAMFSLTIDVFHILNIMIPFWFSLGLCVSDALTKTKTTVKLVNGGEQ